MQDMRVAKFCEYCGRRIYFVRHGSDMPGVRSQIRMGFVYGRSQRKNGYA